MPETRGILLPPGKDSWTVLVAGIKGMAWTLAPDQSKGVAHLRVKGFDNVLTIVREALGYPYIEGGVLQRKVPQNDWVMFRPTDGQPFMFCVGVQVDPLAGDGRQDPSFPTPVPLWDWWHVILHFSTLPYDTFMLSEIGPEPKEAYRYTRFTYRPVSEIVATQREQWVMEIGGVPSEYPPASNMVGVPVPAIELVIEWWDVIAGGYNLGRLTDLANKGNSVAFLGAAAESTLYLGSQITPNTSALGVRQQKIDMRFHYKPNGVNSFLGSNGQWVKLRLRGDVSATPERPIKLADLNDLFRP